MEKTPKELYEERNGRITDAIQLRVPDRIPINLSFGYFPAKYTGISYKTAWYDSDLWLEATKKTIVDFSPDGLFYIQPFVPGTALEYLDPKHIKWPGHGLPDNVGHQAIEGEWMKADEYDVALDNISDYMLRVFFPRISGALKPLKMLPPISSLRFNYNGLISLAEAFARPEVAEAISTLQQAGREYGKIRIKLIAFQQEIERLGFPVTGTGGGGSPFDAVSDYLRGMRGTMTDMYRQPDRLLELIDYQFRKTMDRIEARTSGSVNRRVFIALHRGSDEFMSLPHFEKFYWPTLKKVILSLVDNGLIPCPFFEGVWDRRLEYLLELPRGKVLCHFARTNLKRAKEVLDGHLCIMGGLPSSILQVGSVQDVKDNCKKLIDDCGRDGGFILANMPLDYARPENVKAMVDFTRKYGLYR
jgi:uroporphyrinogen-III decarboxylase